MKTPGFETIGSVAAIVVGVAALFVAWDEAASVRRQQAASVLPIVKMQTPFVNDAQARRFRVEVKNVGVGPAFFDRADILWDGVPVETAEAMKFNVEAVAGDADFWTSELDGQILGGGESLVLYEASWPADAAGAAERAVDTVVLLRASLAIEACYCSVYDDCWRTSLNRLGRPGAVAACDRP